YVADRGNRRIQVFNTDGKFLRQFTIDVPAPADARPAIGNKPTATTGTMSPGAPWTLCITPGPNQVLYTSDAFPAASTNFLSMEKFSASSANPASSSDNSAGFTKSR